ncbi:Dabb family protein [Roseivirga sp. E12]|uniref:Dabb family protein n=1 Tax=Roseivirga sp. E12 TaxID=2819237 RepID=UPI001ABC14A6|nr:Dabb family protein [Roseivirga sp. E12]MBO3700297.1 Dabb family protein [Roseivirga sp. E12]
MTKVCFALLILAFTACHSDIKIKTGENTDSPELSVEPPFIHTVYFWFKEGVTDAQIRDFARASMGLREIQGVLKVYDGTPAATDRPNLEKSYDYALVVLMKDLATHDAYQQDSIHLNLLATYSSMFERVLVTDID